MKVIFESFLENLSFLIYAGCASWAYHLGNKDVGLILWIFACTQLIIKEIKSHEV